MNQEQLDRHLKTVTEEEKHPLDIYGLMKMYDLFPEIPISYGSGQADGAGGGFSVSERHCGIQAGPFLSGGPPPARLDGTCLHVLRLLYSDHRREGGFTERTSVCPDQSEHAPLLGSLRRE